MSSPTLPLPTRRCLLISILLVLGVLLAAGCTQSVHKVIPDRRNSSALDSLSEESLSSRLAEKSSAELLSNGLAYLESGNSTLARVHLLAALNKDRQLSEAYLALGELDFRMGDPEAALGNFQGACNSTACPVESYLGESRVYRSQGKMDKAVEKVNLAMKKAPEDISVIMELATIYDLMGKESLSAPLYREIISRSPDSASGYNNLGLSQMVKGNYPEAIRSLSQALRLNPENGRIRNNLASAYALSGEESNALRLFKATVGEAAAYNNLGYLYMTDGKLEDAEAALRKALELNPRYYARAQENLDRVRQLRKEAME